MATVVVVVVVVVAICCKNYLGWDKLTANAHKPTWNKAKQKSCDDDGDIDSCLLTF